MEYSSVEFVRDKHIAFLATSLNCLPAAVQSQDVNRLTLAYFCVAGLDILEALHEIDRDSVVEWIYSLQVLPTQANNNIGGFRGCPWIGTTYAAEGAPLLNPFDGPSIASTYSALATLATLGAFDRNRIKCNAILSTIAMLQQPTGSFSVALEGSEDDVRFVFCAAAICAMLGSCEGVDVERSKAYLSSCQTYDGGFGLTPGQEAHGGATYCATAALFLFNMLTPSPAPAPAPAPGPAPAPAPVPGSSSLPAQAAAVQEEQRAAQEEQAAAQPRTPASALDTAGQRQRSPAGKPALDDAGLLTANTPQLHWLATRQRPSGGVQGRRNKEPDTCYAFWVGATLHILGHTDILDRSALTQFLLSCQNQKVGGFGKYPWSSPDLLHTFYSICGLSLAAFPSLTPLSPALGISRKAADSVLRH